jgi:uncharacterized protein (DUF1778 family)
MNYECNRCQDRSVVGGFLPAPCPLCRPDNASPELDAFYAATRGYTEGSPLDVFRRLVSVEAELSQEKIKTLSLGAERDAAIRERDEYRRLAQLEDADAAIILDLLEQAPPPTQALRELMARSAPNAIDGARSHVDIERDTAEAIAAWLEDGDGALEQVIARDIRAGAWRQK